MPTTATSTPRWWQWPTVLSLDAPAVVIAWQWLFGTVARAPVRWPEILVVGASVWLAYAADRWIEGWRLTAETIQTPRHRFYHDHRWPVAAVWIAILLTAVAVSLVELSRREFVAGLILLTPTLLYLLSHQLVHRTHPWRVPKELCVAGLIAGGAAVFVLAAPGVPIGHLIFAVLLFATLCFTNVALIAAWEEEVDATHGQESLARKFEHASRISRLLPHLVLAGALVAGLVLPSGLRLVAGCVAVSAILLRVIDRQEPRMGRQPARVLADVALLTPLVPLLFQLLVR